MSTEDAPATATASPAPTAAPVTFRAVPLVGLVAVAFFALGLSPIAFQANWWFLLLLVPVAVGVVVARTATVVDGAGLRTRTAVGGRRLPWDEVATLRVAARGWVRAVGTGGAETPLPGIRTRDLGRVGEASGGRITVPGPAEAEAAEEHRRELEATRMRLERLRARQAGDADDPVAGETEAGETEAGDRRSAQGEEHGQPDPDPEQEPDEAHRGLGA